MEKLFFCFVTNSFFAWKNAFKAFHFISCFFSSRSYSQWNLVYISARMTPKILLCLISRLLNVLLIFTSTCCVSFTFHRECTMREGAQTEMSVINLSRMWKESCLRILKFFIHNCKIYSLRNKLRNRTKAICSRSWIFLIISLLCTRDWISINSGIKRESGGDFMWFSIPNQQFPFDCANEYEHQQIYFPQIDDEWKRFISTRIPFCVRQNQQKCFRNSNSRIRCSARTS